MAAKRRTDWDEKKIQKYIKEGRGQGRGKDYKPWLRIQDFPSLGVSVRGKGWQTKRQHEFLSLNEKDYFFLFQWSDLVVDIREQYPILDREETISIAESIGISHPRDIKSKTPQ